MDKSDEIKKSISDIHGEIDRAIINHGAGALCTPAVLKLHAKILDLTAQLADVSSRRLERRTDTLIYLTWALVGFTAALLVLTFILVKHG
jgi:hypothetical protein